MPKLSPVSRRELVRKLKVFGFEGPYPGVKEDGGPRPGRWRCGHMKLIDIVGAGPQFFKVGPILRAIERHNSVQMVESGDVQLVNSKVLEFENSKTPFPHKRAGVAFYLSFAKDYQDLDESIRKQARALESQGLKPIDALHLACAERAKANYFITCDDRIIKGYRGKAVKAMNPVDFVIEGR